MKRIHHVCIQTNKYKESIDFYTNILGFKVVQETRGFHGREYNTWLEQNGFMIELQTGKENEELIENSDEATGIVHICFLVEDVKKEVIRIKELGYKKFKLKNDSEFYKVGLCVISKIVAPEGSIIEIRDTQQI